MPLGPLTLMSPQGAVCEHGCGTQWIRHPILTSLTSDVSKWTRIITFLGALVVISRVVKLIQGIKAVGSLPDSASHFHRFLYRVAFCPPHGGTPVRAAHLTYLFWHELPPGFTFVWNWRKDRNVYRRFGCDTTSIVSFVHGSPMIFTRSLEVGRQVLTGGLEKFDKSPDLKGPFSYWGPNIVDEYGDQWRKHRMISSPAFNNDTYASVWDASSKLFAEMVSAQGWSSKVVVELPSIYSVMFKVLAVFPPPNQGSLAIVTNLLTNSQQFSLTIFTSVGFGAPLAWSKPPNQGEGDDLSVPTTRRAYDIMRVFMRSQVNTLRETIGLEVAKGDIKLGKDLFSLLVHASDDVGGKKGLSDDELIGDVFSFLYAGHDTTAQGLTVTLAFLALNFDIQDELVSQIREVTEDRDNDTLLFEDYGKLDKVLAAFYEAIRMYPPGPIVPRVAKKDTVLNVSETNEPRMLFVKMGTHVSSHALIAFIHSTGTNCEPTQRLWSISSGSIITHDIIPTQKSIDLRDGTPRSRIKARTSGKVVTLPGLALVGIYGFHMSIVGID
ncbi:cytochrome P450 [Boletus reticuloceps]|uniref:Cytochrome P450 n=1 Tax=Boletus reticuloceps TaxID=495285 RepID=A0A8I2YH48_9AGAM|nr:cytochrome P450 [Boletus reticuloceps]